MYINTVKTVKRSAKLMCGTATCPNEASEGATLAVRLPNAIPAEWVRGIGGNDDPQTRIPLELQVKHTSCLLCAGARNRLERMWTIQCPPLIEFPYFLCIGAVDALVAVLP